MKHSKILIILTVAVVLTFAVVCVSATFSISDIVVDYHLYTETESLKAEQVLDEFKGRNLLFLDTNEVKSKLLEKTSLRVESVTKKYPYTLSVVLIERPEFFAITVDNGYYILDDEYVVVDKRDNAKNLFDNENNVIVDFPLTEEDKTNTTIKNEFSPTNQILFSSLKTLISSFTSPRDYIEKITFEEREVDTNYYVFFHMKEGVAIEVRKATIHSSEKMVAACEKYFSLADSDRLKGKISVYELDSGEIRAIYTTSEE